MCCLSIKPFGVALDGFLLPPPGSPIAEIYGVLLSRRV